MNTMNLTAWPIEKSAGRSVSLVDTQSLASRYSVTPAQSNSSIISPDFAVSSSNKSEDEKLFDERIRLKLAISKMSMHLPEAWRQSAFSQIDFLHGLADWDDDSTFINQAGFSSFLRFIVFSKPEALPSISVAPNGNPVASWISTDIRAYIEFIAQDVANAVISKMTKRGPEAASWRGPTANLRSFVEGFGASKCLGW